MPFDAMFEPWIVGDISTIGFAHELMESQVRDAIDYMRRNYGSSFSIDLFEKTLYDFDIDYVTLPQYLKDELDQFDVE